MRRVGLALVVSAMAVGIWSQTPPTPPQNAKDITQDVSAPGTALAPTAAINAPASVVRVYVDALTGADAQAMAGLITQALFQSKQVVVTDQSSNATVILRGRIERKPVAAPAAARPSKRTAKTPKVRNLDALDAATDGLPQATVPPDAGLSALPQLPDLNATSDLSQYTYRLDLQAVNPSGDLVWMSPLGNEALTFQPAESAVSATLQPLFTTLKSLSPGH